MNTKQKVLLASCVVGGLGIASLIALKGPGILGLKRNLNDEALLALIKNDQSAFESFIKAGGNLNGTLPLIDGKEYTVAEGMTHFERINFMKHLQEKKIPFIKQVEGKEYDALSLSIAKNNPELLNTLILENPNMDATYGAKKWNLLHMASSMCSHKLTSILHTKGKLNWDTKTKDGSTALTLAAENDCLPMLSYWKDQKADFNKKDGRGMSALSILKKKKDAALVAFAQSFETRSLAAIVTKSAPVEVSFYKKRKIPQDQIVDHAALIEPEDRPLEANETAEFSEFSD